MAEYYGTAILPARPRSPNVAFIDHAGEPACGDCQWERFDLTGPDRLDVSSGCRQRESADPVKQAPHGDDSVLHQCATACATILVALTAVCAV